VSRSAPAKPWRSERRGERGHFEAFLNTARRHADGASLPEFVEQEFRDFLTCGVLPRVPVRQWVLSLPYRLRYLLAWDHALARAVLGVYARVLLGFQRHHTLLFDGVCFAEGKEGTLDFRPLPPSDR
jgi:hypothetical protein